MLETEARGTKKKQSRLVQFAVSLLQNGTLLKFLLWSQRLRVTGSLIDKTFDTQTSLFRPFTGIDELLSDTPGSFDPNSHESLKFSGVAGNKFFWVWDMSYYLKSRGASSDSMWKKARWFPSSPRKKESDYHEFRTSSWCILLSSEHLYMEVYHVLFKR